MVQFAGQYGWICPLCKRVLAPFIHECPYHNMENTTLTTSTSSDSQTITLHNDIKDNDFKYHKINTYYNDNDVNNDNDNKHE